MFRQNRGSDKFIMLGYTKDLSENQFPSLSDHRRSKDEDCPLISVSCSAFAFERYIYMNKPRHYMNMPVALIE